jgi:diaminohydroxyphosphoribosylaminopyrimidine deaminase / 5-amino-6-(5-phosphoribosylamino)uracil reductase
MRSEPRPPADGPAPETAGDATPGDRGRAAPAPIARERLEDAMRRAIVLARRGPRTGGNPRVGCVLLAPDGTTLSEGWHRGAGTPHAEIDALSHLPAGGARGATAVVTLEPCNHWGRTGPCSHALVDAGVARVVYAIDDPGGVSAHGARYLVAHGVAVTAGVLAAEAEALDHEWLVAMRRGRPWTIAKLAMSLDGRGAAADGSSQWITSPASRAHAHRMRADVDGILVGLGTVLQDDPSLTARDEHGALLPHQPVPVVLGHPAQVPADARIRRTHPGGVLTADVPRGLFAPAGRGGTTQREAGGSGATRHEADPAGAADAGQRRLRAVLARLFAPPHDMRLVLVEGGPRTTTAFLTAGLVDEVHAYLAPRLIGGPRTVVGDIGVTSIDAARELTTLEITRLGPDILWRARVEEQ